MTEQGPWQETSHGRDKTNQRVGPKGQKAIVVAVANPTVQVGQNRSASHHRCASIQQRNSVGPFRVANTRNTSKSEARDKVTTGERNSYISKPYGKNMLNLPTELLLQVAERLDAGDCHSLYCVFPAVREVFLRKFALVFDTSCKKTRLDIVDTDRTNVVISRDGYVLCIEKSHSESTKDYEFVVHVWRPSWETRDYWYVDQDGETTMRTVYNPMAY